MPSKGPFGVSGDPLRLCGESACTQTDRQTSVSPIIAVPQFVSVSTQSISQSTLTGASASAGDATTYSACLFECPRQRRHICVVRTGVSKTELLLRHLSLSVCTKASLEALACPRVKHQ